MQYPLVSISYMPWVETLCSDCLKDIAQFTLKLFKCMQVVSSFGHFIYALGWEVVFFIIMKILHKP
jgi:hypothetical protein